jgi:hypothetical protein
VEKLYRPFHILVRAQKQAHPSSLRQDVVGFGFSGCDSFVAHLLRERNID